MTSDSEYYGDTLESVKPHTQPLLVRLGGPLFISGGCVIKSWLTLARHCGDPARERFLSSPHPRNNSLITRSTALPASGKDEAQNGDGEAHQAQHEASFGRSPPVQVILSTTMIVTSSSEATLLRS
jgi:hypothetical protein